MQARGLLKRCIAHLRLIENEKIVNSAIGKEQGMKRKKVRVQVTERLKMKIRKGKERRTQ
jgi:hypothetical protein